MVLARHGFSTISPALILIGLIFLSIVNALHAFHNAVPSFHMVTNELATTALISKNLIQCAEDNTACVFYQSLPSVIPKIEEVFFQVFGTEYVFIQTLAIFSSLCFTLGGFYLGKTICGNYASGLITVIALFVSQIRSATLGYGFIDSQSLIAPGLMFQAVGFFVLALIYAQKYKFAAIAVGVVINFHPVIGAILGAFLIACSGVARKSVKHAFVLTSVVTIFASPNLGSILNELSVTSAEPAAEWWGLMRDFKSHHIFPWRAPLQLIGFLSLVGLLIILCHALRRSHLAIVQTTAVMVSVVLFFTGVSFLGVEVFESRILAATMLSRSSVFLVPVAVALTVLFMGELQRTGDGRNLGNLVLLLLLVPGRTNVEIADTTVLLLISAVALCSHQAPAKTVLALLTLPLLLVLIFGGQIWDAYYFSPNHRALLVVTLLLLLRIPAQSTQTGRRIFGGIAGWVMPIFLCSIAITVGATNTLKQIRDNRNQFAYDDYIAMAEWVGSVIEGNEAVLAPPTFVKLEAAIRAPTYSDYIQPGLSMYAARSAALDLAQLQTIYGYPFSEAEKDGRDIRVILSDRYASIDDAMLERIQFVYPSISFFIRKTGSRVELNQTAIFRNGSFEVFFLKNKATRIFTERPEIKVNPESFLLESSLATDLIDGELLIKGSPSKYSYQLQTPNLSVNKGKTYSIEVDLEVYEGSLQLLALDVASDRFLGSVNINQGDRVTKKMEVEAAGDILRIVVGNNNKKSQSSLFKIGAMTMQSSASFASPPEVWRTKSRVSENKEH